MCSYALSFPPASLYRQPQLTGCFPRRRLSPYADAGATSAHVRMDSPVVFGHLSGASRARAEHLIQLKEEVEAQLARYPGRVTFARIPRERNGVADELAKDGARASKALSADRPR